MKSDNMPPLPSPREGIYSQSLLSGGQARKGENLVNIQPLIDITALTIQTAFVTDRIDGYRPSSLMLIAKPESGKTSTIDLFANYPFIYYANEVTSKTFTDTIFPRAQNGQIRFVLIPDILNCVEKASVTKKPLLQTMKTMVDEGTRRVATPYKTYEYPTPVKVGLISAITRESLTYSSPQQSSLYNDLKRMGFLSRMVPFSYEYPIDNTARIFNFLFGNTPAKKYNIRIPQIQFLSYTETKEYEPKPKLLSQLEQVSLKLAQFSDSYGFRVQKNLQKLCYASAMIDSRDEIEQKDVDHVLFLARWMNFSFNALG
ncbi:MAG: hypothetical protein ABSB28_11805 [Candidatus Bathyarchaeia archaeon]